VFDFRPKEQSRPKTAPSQSGATQGPGTKTRRTATNTTSNANQSKLLPFVVGVILVLLQFVAMKEKKPNKFLIICCCLCSIL